MKKLIYAAAAALGLMAASCGQSQKGTEFFSAEATDSLTVTFGQIVGASMNGQISNAMVTDSTVTKETFLKGLQYSLAADTLDTYMNGMIVGLQIKRQLNNWARMGIKVDQNLLLKVLKETILVDSVPDQIQMQDYDRQFRQWSDSLTAAKAAYERAQLENAPEAIENAAKGEAYIKDVVAKDPEVKVSASGLAYKIENPGEEPKVEATNRVVISYTARRADGVVVDSKNSMPTMLSSRTEGLREGVQMLGKGGKATLYVPGKLAYGVDVPQRMDVGPNELLIYEVEVVDIPAPAGQPLR